ncbi:hypothetical protein GU700_21610 [Methylobacterium sp. NI91]|nr:MULTISPECIES: hypothetical protein [unclassified Methylobacterium]QIJ76946.1 hypothetical protein CLZ_21605 [Methylobacterium sp. CLZ]QIJ81850.1 hypothetical protein GU700_21610 [Methylobacterium sp. NI91]
MKPLTRRRLPPFMLARPVSTKKVTLPAVTTHCLNDADIGLPEDPVAQQRAEEAIRAAISYRLRQEAKAKPALIQAVEVTLDDDSLSIRDVPADVLDGIASEPRRIAYRPSSDIHPTAHRGRTMSRTPT